MIRLLRRLNDDDTGFAYTTELLFAVTFIIAVAVIGGVALRNSLISELSEVANAILQLNQSFSFAGESNCKGSFAGSAAFDVPDFIGARTVAAGPFGNGAGGNNISDFVCD